jgi:lactate dehydrogenase-like 2-hydroxyacid dehydrogenase
MFLKMNLLQMIYMIKIKPDMNCILTPHISGVTTESNIRVSNFIVKKTIEFFK